jgi:hypothetical protein
MSSRVRPRSALACMLVSTLALAAIAVAATEPCPVGPVDPAALPQICAPVRGAPEQAVGPEAVTIRSIDREYLGSLALWAAPQQGGAFVLAGELPDLAGHAALTPAGDASLWPCKVQVDDPEARFAPVSLVSADAGSQLTLASGPLDALREPGQTSLLILYADRAVRIDGTCVEEHGTLHVGFSLESGWNVIVSEVEDVVEERVTFRLRDASEDDLEGIAFYWAALAGSLHEGPPPIVRPVEPPAGR